jgi:hypothetical protein
MLPIATGKLTSKSSPGSVSHCQHLVVNAGLTAFFAENLREECAIITASQRHSHNDASL